ncbi:hypothetical protein [Chryseobacterium defluvii]|uniref:Uncharacterized protein n=1 Tax=Chryseobacterium defluvii TaxID=160396 RepID=A0A495SNZ1_9FLAO|nr:hypothetical protein [Chryseobacterium defluvii]RKT01084.1 hypothetical protein BCF58_0298 [Chryseobacterium defluvii]
MKAIEFKEQNVVFAENQPEYLSLPAFKSEEGDVVTCWELSDEEIEKIKETKNIFLAIKTFNHPLQPIFITVDRKELFTD